MAQQQGQLKTTDQKDFQPNYRVFCSFFCLQFSAVNLPSLFPATALKFGRWEVCKILLIVLLVFF